MNFILTLDYELFGDGSGNVFEHMINPTERILKICENHDIRTTIFFEVVEYLKIKKEWDKGDTMGYLKNPIDAIEKQLQKAAKNGHDIQLHIHPQWLNAKFKNNKWEVDFSNWRLGDFKVINGYTIEWLLFEGKKTLEELIQKVVPEYRCIALRAGGYNIMPSADVYAAMKKIGLTIDSSVFPGGYETSNLSNYDYRHVKHDMNYWWGSEKDITVNSYGNGSILELPIFALEQSRWRKFISSKKIKSLIIDSRSVSSLTKAKMSKKSWMDKLRYFFEKEALTWDFCIFNTMLNNRFLYHLDKEFQKKRNYFVLVGHPKSLSNPNNINKLIIKIKKSNGKFLTIAEFEKEHVTQNTI